MVILQYLLMSNIFNPYFALISDSVSLSLTI